MTSLRATFPDIDTLERELEENISMGGLFIRGASGVSDRERCTVLLVHPDTDATLELDAQAVWIVAHGDGAGVGVQLVDYSADVHSRIQDFIEAQNDSNDDDDDGRRGGGLALNPIQRVRGLSGAEQRKVARGGDIQERVALERVYGKAVWEMLLSNPRLSVPEVARIARMGNLPTPLIDQICSNAAWTRAPQVRRALLSHPRLSKDNARKLLRTTPSNELKLIAQQSRYPATVRTLAQQLTRS